MKRILLSLLALLALQPAQAEVWQARYGVAETFNFKLYNADGTLDVDEADGGTEVSLSCNEGAETTATNDFVDEGTFYSIALTATEMQCERIAVVIAATTTEVFFVQTSGNASAMTPTYEVNVASVTSGAIEAADFTLTAAFPALGIVDSGTAQAATGTTLQLRSAAAFADDELIGATIVITGGSAGVGQARTITDYVSSTDTATVATWTTTPTGTITYTVFGTAASSGGSGLDAAGVRSALGLASANLDTQLSAIDDYVDTEVAAIYSRIGAPAGASIAADLAAIKVDTAAILVDTGTTLDGLITTVDTVVDAIKAKTDQLTFGVTNQLNVNLESVNTVTINGDGSATPFGP